MNNKRQIIVIGMCLLALLPRVLGMGDFWTRDEPFHWRWRAETFLHALQQHDFIHTNLTGHPGVTTMWLGATGLFVQQQLVHLGWDAVANPAWQRVLLRLPLAVVTAMCVVLAYLLLRYLFDGRVALLAAMFWATDPFLVAYSQVLHLDALLASFMTLSLLTALVATGRCAAFNHADCQRRINWPWWVASAIAGGLALLTKSPSVLLLPMIGLIALVGIVPLQRLSSLPANLAPWFGMMRQLFVALLVWIVSACLTCFILWPALWVDLPGTVMSVVSEVIDNGGKPHETGNFLLGQPVEAPGLWFYPLVVLLRMTPWAMIGLLVASGLGIAVMWSRIRSCQHVAETGQALIILSIFIFLFTTAVSILPKKMDRYILSIFPLLNIMAAWGWIGILDRVKGRWRLPIVQRLHGVMLQRLVWLVVIAGLTANLAWYYPYALAYYNPLLGGGPVAAHTIPVGWGEGLDQVADFLTTETGSCEPLVAAWHWQLLLDTICMPLTQLDQAIKSPDVDYAVMYIDQLQRGGEPETTAALRQMIPIHTVHIHGIDYAYIYQIPPPVEHVLTADFGSAIHLRGYTLHTEAVDDHGTLALTLQWQARGVIDREYMLFIHVLSADGQIVQRVDVPPGGPDAPTSQWKLYRFITWVHTVPIPASIPSGTYWIALGVYDPQDFSRLPVHRSPPPSAPDDGPNALMIGPVTLNH